jgi:hypothetical protein
MLQNSLVTALIEIILSIIEVGASVNGDYSELMYICIESLLMGALPQNIKIACSQL